MKCSYPIKDGYTHSLRDGEFREIYRDCNNKVKYKIIYSVYNKVRNRKYEKELYCCKKHLIKFTNSKSITILKTNKIA